LGNIWELIGNPLELEGNKVKMKKNPSPPNPKLKRKKIKAL
jgi:hypothetical protein